MGSRGQSFEHNGARNIYGIYDPSDRKIPSKLSVTSRETLDGPRSIVTEGQAPNLSPSKNRMDSDSFMRERPSVKVNQTDVPRTEIQSNHKKEVMDLNASTKSVISTVTPT